MSQQEELNSLKKRISDLEKENALLKQNQVVAQPGNTVKVPENIKPLFDRAQQTVGDYFRNLKMDPTHGTIEIHNERYVLVRASALSHDFLNTIQQLYADKGEKEAIKIGKNFLFDIAHVIGVNDARKFHEEMKLTEPIAKLAAGPVHFAYSGWAFVDILPESKPSPDDDFYLIYNHPYSFEADSWIRAGHKASRPVCVMNAGYSSGWCEESFGIKLTAVEVTCKAKGDKNCTFIMSPPTKIKEHLEKYKLQEPQLHLEKNKYDIPTFFKRKKVEEQLALYALIISSTDEAILSATTDGIITSWNQAAEKLFGYKATDAIGKQVCMLIADDRQKEWLVLFRKVLQGHSVNQYETIWKCKDGRLLDIALTISAVKNADDQLVGISVIGRDISKRKKAEEELRQLNNSLEEQVQERTADLKRAYDELETRVTFRGLELEKKIRANLARIAELEKQIADLSKK